MASILIIVMYATSVHDDSVLNLQEIATVPNTKIANWVHIIGRRQVGGIKKVPGAVVSSFCRCCWINPAQ